MKRFAALLLMLIFVIILAGCATPADVASQNISLQADNFKVDRRIVFYNGITDSYILVVEGKCSLGNADAMGELSVTCKVGDDKYFKHFLGLSDNVTYFAEQIAPANVDPYHYKVIFRPAVIIPDIGIDLGQ